MAGNSKSGREAARTGSRTAGPVVRFWHTLRKDVFDSYRPERHYMRGPGPKWHAKHDYALGHRN